MTHLFAVEKNPSEIAHEVAEILLRTADKIGFKCPDLEAFDTFQVGTTTFLRFSTEVRPDKLVEAVFKLGRAVVSKGDEGFVARFKSKSGKVSSTTMLLMPRQQTKYRGPGSPHWERQFLPA